MTRREFALAAAFQPPPPALRDARYQHIKGFNYVPSYAASIWEVIDHFDAKVWDREFGYAKRFHANAMRIWCDYLSFQKGEKHFLKSWETALALAVKHGYQVMVTTANRWTDPVWSFGQLDLAFIVGGAPSSEFLRYLKTFAGAFRNHPAVLMWDLCNESYFYPGVRAAAAAEKTFLEQLMTRETAYWAKAIETVRSAGASQPVTLGVMRNAPEESLRMVDVISCHPYPGWGRSHGVPVELRLVRGGRQPARKAADCERDLPGQQEQPDPDPDHPEFDPLTRAPQNRLAGVAVEGGQDSDSAVGSYGP